LGKCELYHNKNPCLNSPSGRSVAKVRVNRLV
jgi:hypothetical protein